MKTKKLLIGLLSTILTLILCQGFMATFANTDEREATPVEQTQVTLTKMIKMHAHTTTPNIEFTFNVEKVSVDDRNNGDDYDAMPDLKITPLTFTSKDKGITDDKTSIKTVTKSIDNIVPDASEFPHAGNYIYEISENDTEFLEMIYDKSIYRLNVEVHNEGEDSKKIGKVSISTVDSDGGKIPCDQISFTNTYIKTTEGKPGVEDSNALVISNTVTGKFGDKTKDFGYTITIKFPTFVTALMDVESITGIHTDKNGSKTEINIMLGEAKKFYLKDGETLSIKKLFVGTSVVVGQDRAREYKTSNFLTANWGGNSGGDQRKFEIVDKENKLAWTNNKEESSVPTGITMNNLPFIGLIIVSLGGFVLYILSRKKYHS